MTNVKDEYYQCKEELALIEENKAKGSIVRSKVKWLEHGEKGTQYFFDLEKYNSTKKHVRKIIVRNNEIITDSGQILNESVNFYKKLYQSNNGDLDYEHFNRLFNVENIPQLSNEERVFCDGEILEEECHECLLTCKNNKSPGNDGLTKEFLKYFGKYCVSHY